MKGSSREKNYQEMDLQLLHYRQCYEKLCYFYNFNEKSFDYLFQLTPPKKPLFTTRNAGDIPFLEVNHNVFNIFKNSFFPSAIIELTELALDLRNPDFYSASKKYFKLYTSFFK